MESLSEIAQKQANKINRRPDLPGWWPLVTYLLAAGFIVYLFFSLIAGNGAPERSAHHGSAGSSLILGSATTSRGSGAGSTTPTTASPSTTTPSTSATGSVTQVSSVNGGTASVPTGAYQVAQEAGLALYTTNTSAVPLATGVSFPPLSTAYRQAQIVSTELVSSSADTYVIRVTVDPGPPAQSGDLFVDITVVDQSGSWKYESGS